MHNDRDVFINLELKTQLNLFILLGVFCLVVFFAEKSDLWLATGQWGHKFHCEEMAECYFLVCQLHFL